MGLLAAVAKKEEKLWQSDKVRPNFTKWKELGQRVEIPKMN